MSSGIQYDEKGRPYSLIGGTNRRSYISPVAMGTGSRPTDGGGILRTDYGWDTNKGEWTRGVDWGNVASLGVGGMLAAPFIAPVIGGIGGGSAAAPTTTAAATGGGGAGTFGIGATAPTFGASTLGAAPAAAAATGGGTVAGTGGLSFGKLLALGGMGTGFDLLGSLLGGGGGEDPKQSFAGRRGSNGVSVDPTEVYSQGLGLLQGAVPQISNRMKSPTRLRTMAQNVPGLTGSDPRLRDPQGGEGGDDMVQLHTLLKMLGL